MMGIPSHARSASVTQTALGPSCTQVEIALPEAVDDDDRELFVACWCVHPRLIPDEKITGIPEPQVHVHEGPLYLRAEEVIHAELPALTYLVRLRIVEFQDWTTPLSLPDDDGWGGRDDDDDSSDSNRAKFIAGPLTWLKMSSRFQNF